MTHLVLSADAFIRFRNGEVVIHNSHSRQPAVTSRDVLLVAFVAQFAQPVDVDDMLGRLAPAAREQTSVLISRLNAMGVLVARAAPGADCPDEQDLALARAQLGILADSTHELAADLAAIGTPAAAYVRKTTAISLESRLASLLAAVDSLRTSLEPMRRELLAEQLRRVGVDAQSRGLKVHLGAGSQRLDGWINVDVGPADVSVNLARHLPFPDDSASFIFAAHVLEHLYHPEQSLRLLADCLRVLAPGGVLRIVVPDIEQCLRAYANGDRGFFTERAAAWPGWPQGRTPLEDFLAYAGAGPRPSAFLESHKYGYDFETLSRALTRAGFAEVTRSAFMASAHPELRVDGASAVAHATHGTEHYSLFVEARRPQAP